MLALLATVVMVNLNQHGNMTNNQGIKICVCIFLVFIIIGIWTTINQMYPHLEMEEADESYPETHLVADSAGHKDSVAIFFK